MLKSGVPNANSDSGWRNRAAPIIAKVLAETAGQPEAVIRKALKDAYPFGPRKHHPYKIWCSEVQLQRGTKKAKVYVGQLKFGERPEGF